METDYWHALDKRTAEQFQINPKILGISHGIGDVAKGLKANIFAGGSVVELGFMGVGKGSRSTPTGVTPELFGKAEREDMRNMAKINDVVVTTHATANIQGFAGLDPQGGFKAEKREEALHEIERAIDFAADVGQGGPVVIHAGEFPRPIFETGKEFEAYKGEEKKAPVYLVDSKSEKIISLPRDTEINVPLLDKEGMLQVDKKGEIITKKVDYDYYVKKQDELNKEYHKKFIERGIPENEIPKKFSPAQLFYTDYMEQQRERASAEERRWAHDMKEQQEGFKQIQELRKKIETIKEPEKIAEKLMEAGIKPTPELLEDPKGFLKKIEESREHAYNYYKDGAISFAKQRKDIEDQQKNLKPIEEYAINKSAETIARAAITAFDREVAQKLPNPLFIAPENIFPESYGAHPQELKNLILESRAAMTKKLQDERHITKQEAEKISADHIKATFDIGHANTWKKFYKGKPEEFNKWMGEQVLDLQKAGIIGHVHISDNFGYYDEHVTPGEGTAPIKELVEKLKKENFKGVMVVEPGAQPEGQIFEALKGAWRTLSSPVYRIDTTGLAWTDVEGSYFGRTGSPTYVVGDYAPSKDWSLWSETALE